MSEIAAVVRTASVSAVIGAASIAGAIVGQVSAPGAAVAAVAGQVAGNRVAGSVSTTSLVGIVTVGGGAAPALDSWNGTW